MIYSITPSPIKREQLLRFGQLATIADITRGSILARALGGRWVNASAGYHLRPVKARQFARLFDAGVSVLRRYKPEPVDCWSHPSCGADEFPLRKVLEICRKAERIQNPNPTPPCSNSNAN